MPISKSSTIMVTGGTGFLGSAVMAALYSKGYRRISTFGSNVFDLTDYKSADALFKSTRPEVVIHLAAKVGGIGANRDNPGLFAYSNLMMGSHVIELSRIYGVKKLVTAGTICAYPKITPIPFKEENLWAGYPEETNAPYGMAKKMLLVLSQAYRQQYGSNFTYLLPVNLFGPGDNFDLESSHVIPAMMRKFHEAKEKGLDDVSLWGDGTPTREFLYVDDCANAFVSAMENYDGREPINIGSGHEITMARLAILIKEIVGCKANIIWDSSKPNGQPRRCLDTHKAKYLLKWEASTELIDGLRKTYEWYLENQK